MTTAANLIQYAESYIASRDKEDERLPQEAEFFRETYDMAKTFLELVSVLDTVIENAEQDIAHLENSPYGDPVWREREGVRLAKRLETYKALRAKCG